jgi:hypothetical protein
MKLYFYQIITHFESKSYKLKLQHTEKKTIYNLKIGKFNVKEVMNLIYMYIYSSKIK